MRQLVSIALLALLLFNMLGHYPVYLGMQWNARQDMEKRLDTEDLEGQELFELKIPMNLPYWHNMADYERVSGKFEHNGEFYNLFKQKIQDDTLHLVCVRDRTQKQLFEKLSEVVQFTFGDMPGTHQKAAKFLENLLKDYLPLSTQLALAPERICELAQEALPPYAVAPYAAPFSSFSPPPEASLALFSIV